MNRNALNILIVLAIFALLLWFFKKDQPPRIDYERVTFNRPDVRINHITFDTLQDLTRYLKAKGYKRSGQHRGLAIWSLDKQGNPIGACTIYYVYGDEETRQHEERHCREGQWHPIR